MKLKSLFVSVAMLLYALPSQAQLKAEANYSVENQLVAGTLADVAFSVTDNGTPMKNISGRLLDEDGNVAATLNSDEHGQGIFMFVPEKRQYHVEWDIDGQLFCTDFIDVKDSGYVWSIDNVSRATYIQSNKSAIEKESFTDLELEQVAKNTHKITQYIKEYKDIPDHNFSDPHKFTIAGRIFPIDCHSIASDYVTIIDRLQGKNILDEEDLHTPDRHLHIKDDIKVWIERPKEMAGDSLWVEIYQGDRRVDTDAVDLREANIACLRFLLNDMPQGNLEIRLLDKEHHIMATRNIKASHNIQDYSYEDARKTDIDCRLKGGNIYPFMAASDNGNLCNEDDSDLNRVFFNVTR